MTKYQWVKSGLLADRVMLGYWLVALLVYLALLPLGIGQLDPLVATMVLELPPQSRTVFRWVTDFGKSEYELVPAGIGVLALFFLRKKALSKPVDVLMAHLSNLLVFVFVCVAGSGLLAQLFKHLIGRARPRYFETLGSSAFDPFAFKHSFASLPSGHATTVFAMAMIISIVKPRYAVISFILASAIALTRVLVGAHYVMDVLAGALLGTGFVIVMRGMFSYHRLVFQNHNNGRFSLRGRRLLAALIARKKQV